MKHIFFTVGPSQLYPTVKTHIVQAMQEDVGSLSHRGTWFQKLYNETSDLLRQLLSVPSTHKIFFIASGTEAMERTIQNCVSKKSFHIISGSFSTRFAQISKEMGKNPQTFMFNLDVPPHKQTLNIPKNSELICFTQSETSTGVMIPENLIAKTKKNNPGMLIAVDTVSSSPFVTLDYKNTDCVFFSVQKGFGLPAGLGVMVVSPQALEKSAFLQKTMSIGSYHNFPTLLEYQKKGETPETPPVLEIYLLNKVLKDMVELGISAIRKETIEKAKLLYDFFDTHTSWKPFVPQIEYRSQTVVVVDMKNSAENVRTHLQKNGLHVGMGYGEYKNRHLRIGNFPATSIEDMKKLVSAFRNSS